MSQVHFDPTTSPAPVEEKEPMLLLDITGSMNFPIAEGSTTSRKSVVQEALSIVVSALAKEDSQAAHEESGGGLRTITFADGTAHDIEDINPTNLRQKWNAIHWGGGTYIMPGFNLLKSVYREEFGKQPPDQRPKLIALIITDGEAEDTSAFADAVSQVGGGMYVEIALLGFGDEHDRALAAYQRIASTNMHVKVTSFAEETNPQTLADGLLRMIA